jgi:DNA repair exonuclease SbcCD ATPase subunit
LPWEAENDQKVNDLLRGQAIADAGRYQDDIFQLRQQLAVAERQLGEISGLTEGIQNDLDSIDVGDATASAATRQELEALLAQMNAVRQLYTDENAINFDGKPTVKGLPENLLAAFEERKGSVTVDELVPDIEASIALAREHFDELDGTLS